jgi:hypothetical protein
MVLLPEGEVCDTWKPLKKQKNPMLFGKSGVAG